MLTAHAARARRVRSRNPATAARSRSPSPTSRTTGPTSSPTSTARATSRFPQSRIIAGRPGVKLPPCQGERLSYRDVAGNAFYCCGDNFVVYDDAHLFPDLYADIGPFAVALVLAHEWGHAVQDRAGESRPIARSTGAPGRLLRRRRGPRTSPRRRRPVAVRAGRPRSLARGAAAVPRRARVVARRPVGPRQRVRPGERVPGRLRVRARRAAPTTSIDPPLVVQLPFSSAGRRAARAATCPPPT